MLNFKRRRFQSEIILICIRWYLAYPLSYRHIEEMMKERGVAVDHSTINRWVLKYTLEIEKKFRKYKNPVNGSWRMDESVPRISSKRSLLENAMFRMRDGPSYSIFRSWIQTTLSC